jgi:ABC-2 type transport system ATP-binding protein
MPTYLSSRICAFGPELYGLNGPRLAEAAIHDFDLGEYARSSGGEVSGGWARLLQLSAALIHSPRLIILDEPTAGLDTVSRQHVWQRIGRLAALGASVIISTHDLGEGERCTHAALLSEARVITTGTPEHIVRSAPADAFVLSGGYAHLLAPSVEAVAGVIATYAQGSYLRIIADAKAEESLSGLASVNHVSLIAAPMRLEDAVLAFSARPSER